jgi:catechol 2,3-dioxygenase-like lactoylglutathione lyase family enzyme
MSIKSLAHVCIKVGNLKRTIEFYCGALGLTKLFDFTQKGNVVGCYMKAANDTFIEAFETGCARPASEEQPAVLDHFCLETDTIEALRRTLLEKDYAPTEIIMGADQARQFWVKDPDGLKLEIQEYNRTSSQFTGRDVDIS